MLKRMENKYLKLFLTAVFIVSGALIVTQVLDERGQEYTNDALKRSLVTFGVARTLNGVISVAQGTEIAFQPAGVGMTFTPGQILDPVNDLVERFSWVMLLSSASIGIQKTLLTISAWSWFSGIALATFVLAIVTLWLPRLQNHYVSSFVLKLALLALVLRLSVPCIAILSEGVYQGFLAPQYNEATKELKNTTESIGRIHQQTQRNATAESEPDSIWDAAKNLYQSASDTIDIEAQLEQYKQATAEASEQLVSLVVVFIFQTVILPLVFLAGLYLLVKRLIAIRLPGF